MNTLTQNRLNQALIVLSIVSVAVLMFGDLTYAQSLAEQAQDGVDAVGPTSGSKDFGDTIIDVVNFLLYAVGILSVIMVIVGGIRYVLSAGDANATKGARDTILYAIVGLVVAFVAYGIVNFVTGVFG